MQVLWFFLCLKKMDTLSFLSRADCITEIGDVYILNLKKMATYGYVVLCKKNDDGHCAHERPRFVLLDYNQPFSVFDYCILCSSSDKVSEARFSSSDLRHLTVVSSNNHYHTSGPFVSRAIRF